MSKFKKFLIFSFIIIIILGGIIGFVGYKMAFSPNVNISNDSIYLYISSNRSFQAVVDSLTQNNIIENKKSFMLISKLKKYDDLVKPGKYKITNGMNNWELVNHLRSGKQEPIMVVVPSVRVLSDFCEKIAPNFECTEDELSNYLNSNEFFEKYGLNEYNAISLFIPNTYEFYWNTSAEEFVERMKSEYDKFWTVIRTGKAENLGLTPLEVSVLASIVQSEQAAHPDERPTIAGLYLNRLKIGMPLQSDPTLIFALGDFSVKRVYDFHKKIQSPYNTYLNIGLPPGPILLPEISSIDAVLNPKESKYLYMCAKEDLSGYHYFSDNLTQHTIYAKRYHNALNALDIR
ncbi:MAG: endolytic transglycosylase MltG [Bacteroidales bacterium]|nr:endolytic transglycosylase MltG [Bacteroidales bacterium]